MKMNDTILKQDFQGKTYIIEKDLPEVGAYLYIYKDKKNIADYLQDNGM